MKILHIINSLSPGGAEKLLEQTLPLLNDKQRNIQVDVLLLRDKNNIYDKSLQAQGLKVTVVPLKRVRSPLNIFYIKKHIVQGKYDLIHVHLFPSNYWTAIAAMFIRKNKPKFIATEHNTYNRRREKKLFKYIDRFIYSHFDKIIFISDLAKDHFISWIKLKKQQQDKLKVIQNGVAVDKFIKAKSYLKSELNSSFDEKSFLICMVSRFDINKDQESLIKAFSELSKDSHLILIGYGPLKDKCISLAKSLKVLERIHFYHFRDDIAKILKTADVVVLSSNWEGLSLSSIEGMASGKPFVASDVPGLTEIVKGYGLLFPQGDYLELSKLLKKLQSDTVFYQKIASRCVMRAKMFDISYMINKTLAVYQDLLANSNKTKRT